MRRLFFGGHSSGDSVKPHVGNPETSTKIKIGRVRRVFGGGQFFWVFFFLPKIPSIPVWFVVPRAECKANGAPLVRDWHAQQVLDANRWKQLNSI